jgi:hypothetical protein
MVRAFRFVTVLALLAVAASASAQFGHPLKGTWSGDWGPGGNAATNRTHVVLELNWDGKNISGSINPGANGVALTKATLDPATWMVHLEGDGKNPQGAAAHYVIDGKLENLGAAARFITGTWTEGSQKGNFKITRN